jgi:hypothetical protein
MNQQLAVPNDEEVRREGTEALIRSLGIAKAAMFCRRNLSQKIDYLEVKEHLFGQKSVTDLYHDIAAERD